MSLLTKKDPFEKLANLTFCLAIRLSKAEKKWKDQKFFSHALFLVFKVPRNNAKSKRDFFLHELWNAIINSLCVTFDLFAILWIFIEVNHVVPYSDFSYNTVFENA